jgi:hypothetical protein
LADGGEACLLLTLVASSQRTAKQWSRFLLDRQTQQELCAPE